MLLNALQQKPLYKIAIYGPGGCGKTFIGARAPKPLILLFERHGFETIRTAAKMANEPMPPVIWVRTLSQLKRVQAILAQNTKDPIAAMMRDDEVITEVALMEAGTSREDLVASLPYAKPETVVLDSLSEACDMIASHIDAHGGQETDRSGLTYRKLKAWTPITEKGAALIRAFRDVPYHVLFLCLVDERNHGDEDNPEMHYGPAMPGRQLAKKLITAVNALGLVVLRQGKKDGRMVTRRWVQFVTPDHVSSKVAHPLRPREPANAASWFHALEHKVQIASVPEEVAAEEAAAEDEEETEKKEK